MISNNSSINVNQTMPNSIINMEGENVNDFSANFQRKKDGTYNLILCLAEKIARFNLIIFSLLFYTGFFCFVYFFKIQTNFR